MEAKVKEMVFPAQGAEPRLERAVDGAGSLENRAGIEPEEVRG
jgi:hypothetical protein